MSSIVYVSLYVARLFPVIVAIRSSLLFQLEGIVPLEVRFVNGPLLRFLIVGIHASGISIPLYLLMILGWNLMWMVSSTLRVYQRGSRSINVTSFQIGRCPVSLARSENSGGLCTSKPYVLSHVLLSLQKCFPKIAPLLLSNVLQSKEPLFSCRGIVRNQFYWLILFFRMIPWLIRSELRELMSSAVGSRLSSCCLPSSQYASSCKLLSYVLVMLLDSINTYFYTDDNKFWNLAEKSAYSVEELSWRCSWGDWH